MNYFSWTVFQCCMICLCLILCCSVWITSIATFTDGLCAGLTSKPEPKSAFQKTVWNKKNIFSCNYLVYIQITVLIEYSKGDKYKTVKWLFFRSHCNTEDMSFYSVIKQPEIDQQDHRRS